MATFPVELQVILEALTRAVLAQVLQTQPTLATAPWSTIEAVLIEAGQQFQQCLTQELVQASAARIETDWPRCSICQTRLRAKGKRTRRLAPLSLFEAKSQKIASKTPIFFQKVCNTRLHMCGSDFRRRLRRKLQLKLREQQLLRIFRYRICGMRNSRPSVVGMCTSIIWIIRFW